MAENVDVPAIGNVEKKWVYAGVAVTAGIVGYAYWKKRQASPVGVAVDPTTGSLTGSGVYSNPAPQSGTTVDSNEAPGAPRTNQEWTTRVVTALGDIGLDPAYVAGVIGKYLGSQKLTQDEAAVIRQAWAFQGKPPGGPTNFTLADSTPAPGGSTPPPATDTGSYYTTVLAGWHVDQWIFDLRAGLAGIQVPNITYDQLVALNPQMPGNIEWDGAKTGTSADNVFRALAVYRIR